MNVKSLMRKYQKAKSVINKISAIWNIISLILFSLYTLLSIYLQWSSLIMRIILLSSVGIYIIIFIVLAVFNRKKTKNLRRNIGDYKSGIKILRNILKIGNLVIIILMLIESVKDNPFDSVVRIIVLVTVISMAVFVIIFEIIKIIWRHIKSKIDLKRIFNKTDMPVGTEMTKVIED